MNVNKSKPMRLCIKIIILLSILTGCAQSESSEVANELHFPLDNITELEISYDEEPITFIESSSDELVIKEYMSIDKENYHASVSQSNGCIHISEGGKPFLKSGFYRYVEVYLPASYHNALTVTTTDGEIDISNVGLTASKLRIDSTSGTVRLCDANGSSIHLSSTSGTLDLGSIHADEIKLETTQGTVTCDNLNGHVTYASTSGNAEIKHAVGSGNYQSNNSGMLQVTYTEVTGDLSFFNKNDDIILKLPENLAFELEATTKNGEISTTFEQQLSVQEHTITGTIGDNPTVSITAETKNGNIQITQ